MPKKPPPLVPSIFIGTKAASGPTTMALLLGLAVTVGAHRSRFERVDLILTLIGHRHAL